MKTYWELGNTIYKKEALIIVTNNYSKEKSAKVRLWIAYSLGLIGGDASVIALQSLLDEKKEKEFVVSAAADALRKLKKLQLVQHIDYSRMNEIDAYIEKKQKSFSGLIQFTDIFESRWGHLLVVLFSSLIGNITGAIITILLNYFGLVN